MKKREKGGILRLHWISNLRNDGLDLNKKVEGNRASTETPMSADVKVG